jgi:mannose-6-phosphate isomerase-like protein (cupin superfamily)
VAEFYYVMNGAGKATVGGGGRGGAAESAAIRAGDVVPLQLGEAHAFENTGSEPLEFLIVGVARDMSKRVDTIDVGAGGRGPGR